MVLPIKNDHESNILIDHKETLPFSLAFYEGINGNEKRIDILSLTADPLKIAEHKVELTEYANLRIHLMARHPVQKIMIKIGSIYDIDQQEQKEETIELNSRLDSIHLFTYGMGQEYPWRPGIYHFEVFFNHKRYYGAFEVVPKNVDKDQLIKIHDLINQHLQGLIYDFYSYKETADRPKNLEDVSYWRYLNWYKEIEKPLLKGLKDIEKNSQLELTSHYKIENQPKHMTEKSIRWNHSTKGVIYQGTRFYNRTMALHWDSYQNRLAKFRLLLILMQLEKSMKSLIDIYQEDLYFSEKVRSDIEDLKNQLEDMKKTKTIAKRDLDNIYKTLLIKQAEYERSDQRLRALQRLELEFLQYQRSLKNSLQSSFWNQVKNHPPNKTVTGKHAGYKIVDKVWKESQALIKGKGESKETVPVYKPTALLYEYYVYLVTIQILKEEGFQEADQTILQQLGPSFSRHGLLDGATVSLKKDHDLINVVYNELVETHAKTAIKKGTHFYSNEQNRKPDIRIDRYESDNDRKKKYVSSFVIEVKYSPFRNIYNEFGNTDAMLQMSKYWAIKYAYGLNQFNRQAVKQVVCVYPGDPKQEILINGETGIFLQLLPNESDIIGKDQLKELLLQWIW